MEVNRCPGSHGWSAVELLLAPMPTRFTPVEWHLAQGGRRDMSSEQHGELGLGAHTRTLASELLAS